MNPKELCVVVPARGGSKRLPGKNVAGLGGRPLLAYTLDVIVACGLQTVSIVSSDDQKILDLALAAGIGALERPAHLATDEASTESVLLHVLDVRRGRDDVEPDWIMTLPPTSPFRRPDTVKEVLRRALEDPKAPDCLMTTSETRADLWQRTSEGDLARLFPNAPRRQQERIPLYEENSAIYCTRTAALRRTGSILGSNVGGIPIGRIEAWDVNTAEDLAIAEALLQTLT